MGKKERYWERSGNCRDKLMLKRIFKSKLKTNKEATEVGMDVYICREKERCTRGPSTFLG